MLRAPGRSPPIAISLRSGKTPIPISRSSRKPGRSMGSCASSPCTAKFWHFSLYERRSEKLTSRLKVTDNNPIRLSFGFGFRFELSSLHQKCSR